MPAPARRTTDRHFACTACGRCCHGILPLTLAEAVAQADMLPLALLWTIVPANSPSAALTARLGTTVRLAKKKDLPVLVSPVAYLPPGLPCPHLTADNLCAIHDHAKPIRCRTMPFLASREEHDQDDLLVPRPGWTCDVSRQAPLVYSGGAVMAPEAFNAERAALEADAPILRAYADAQARMVPTLPPSLAMLAKRPGGGRLVLPFTGILPRLAALDSTAFLTRQRAVMRSYAQKTEGDATARDFHTFYVDAVQRANLVLAGPPTL